MYKEKKQQLNMGLAMIIVAICLIFVLFMCNSCAAQSLNIAWECGDNADQDSVAYYVLYAFQGDTVGWLSWTEADMDSIGRVTHLYGETTHTYTKGYTFQEEKIIRAGVRAFDSLTRQSPMAKTRFYHWPNYPKLLRLQLP